MMKAKKLKRAVIKEEFVALTGNAECAIILNQFDYWSHRTDDIDAYIEEEIARQDNPEAIDILEKTKTKGWIYKSTKQLLEEVMLSTSEKTARRHLIKLVEHGWLQERDNPDNKWDKRKQYRYNLVKVQEDLQTLGYPLEGWTIVTNPNVPSKGHSDEWKGHYDASEVHHDASQPIHKPTPAVAPTLAEEGPEITTEITTETSTVQETCHSPKEISTNPNYQGFKDSELIGNPKLIEIEEYLSGKIGNTGLALVGEDFKLAREYSARLPLDVIKRGIDNAFEKYPKTRHFKGCVWAIDEVAKEVIEKRSEDKKMEANLAWAKAQLGVTEEENDVA
jgi:hypothetical protein